MANFLKKILNMATYIMANFCKNKSYGNMHYGNLFENNSHSGITNYGLKKT